VVATAATAKGVTPRATAAGIPVFCAFDELADVVALVPNPRNPNKHPDEQISLLARIIKAQGWRAPITVSNRSGFVVRGHGRLEAAKRLGVDVVPVDRQDYANEAEEWADLIADNRLAELAETDESLLKDLLTEVAGTNLDPELTGYTTDAIDDLIAGATPAPEVEEDDVPELPEVATTKRGELWILGDHRLLCGDSTNRNDVLRLMDGRKARLFATDPPYLVDYTGGHRPAASKDWSDVYHEVNIKDGEGFFRSVFTNALEVLEPDSAWYCWHAHRRASLIERIWAELGVLNHEQIIWVKPAASQTFSFYPWQHEPCLMGWRQGHKPRHDGDNSHSVTSVWQVDWEGKARLVGNEHPTQKPVAVFAIPIQKHTVPGDIVFEPFCGSGTQIIAAEQLGRACYAMEIEPTFCDVIIRRWENLTGLKAVREDGTPFETHP